MCDSDYRFHGVPQVLQGSTRFGSAWVPQGSGFHKVPGSPRPTMTAMLTHRRSLALITVLLLVPIAPARPAASPQSETWIDPYREPAARLVGEALSGSFAWERLAELGDTFGHRLSGSQSLDDAIQWAVQQMKKDGLENVHTEPVKVPHWVRGQESAEIVAPRRHAMVMLGLGNSVGTPAEGVEGEILVVGSYEQLDAAADRGLVKGRIVLVQRPVHELQRDRPVPRERSLARRGARRDRGARPLRGSAGAAPAAHRRAQLHGGRAADPRRGHHDGGCRPPAAHAGSRDARPRPPEDGGEVPARRGLVQRGRRNPGPRDDRTKWSSSAATSTRGTSAPARPTTEAGAS